jgi:hypothetical protein
MSLKNLCFAFGVPPATMSRMLHKAQTALLKTFRNHFPYARSKWPTKEEQEYFANLVSAQYPLIKGRWGFIDGKNYKVQKPSSADLQNAMYNGWLHATLVTGCFCFRVDGTVAWGEHNIVGSWNDGDISRDFQLKLLNDEINIPDFGVLSDSAFPVSGHLYRRIMTPLKEGDIEKVPPECVQGCLLVSNQITACRQACEWGMGAVEKVYRRLLLPLPYNPIKRGVMLTNIYTLYNFRVCHTGISQIRSVFMNN